MASVIRAHRRRPENTIQGGLHIPGAARSRFNHEDSVTQHVPRTVDWTPAAGRWGKSHLGRRRTVQELRAHYGVICGIGKTEVQLLREQPPSKDQVVKAVHTLGLELSMTSSREYRWKVHVSGFSDQVLLKTQQKTLAGVLRWVQRQ